MLSLPGQAQLGDEASAGTIHGSVVVGVLGRIFDNGLLPLCAERVLDQSGSLCAEQARKRKVAMLGFEVIGRGDRPVVVLNDWLCDTSTWGPSLPYLDGDAFTWAFTDLRGYGRSRGQTGTFSAQEAAEDVTELADKFGWQRFTVVGHSMSTLVALHLGQTRPERIADIVLVTPPPPTGLGYDDATHAAVRDVALGDDPLRMKALGLMIGTRLGPSWVRFKAERWRATAEPAAAAGYVALFGVRGIPDRTTRVQSPVLAVTGEQDAPPMRRDAAERSLAPLCPRLTLASIEECGHYPMQETPPLFVSTVQAFLTKASHESNDQG